MSQCDIRFSIKLALVAFTLLVASAARASLVECNANSAVNALSGAECPTVVEAASKAPVYTVTAETPSVQAVSTQASFEIDQNRRADFMSNSVPLLLLISVFIAFLLVRAKRFNTK